MRICDSYIRPDRKKQDPESTSITIIWPHVNIPRSGIMKVQRNQDNTTNAHEICTEARVLRLVVSFRKVAGPDELNSHR